jgi:hypothetical protein
MRTSLIVALSLALMACSSKDPVLGQLDASVASQDDAALPDESPPTVAIDIARYGLVQAERSFTVTAQDDVGITRVTLEVDGTVAAETTTAPFALAWDSTQTADGVHQVRFVAYDAAGNRGETPETPVLVLNQGTVPEMDDAELENGLIKDRFEVPADWDGDEEYIDLKYHWSMPEGMTRVVAILQWPDASAGWNLKFDVGRGFCPDHGTKFGGLTGSSGEIVLVAPQTPKALPEGQWFVHVGAVNADAMMGQSTSFSIRLAYLP